MAAGPHDADPLPELLVCAPGLVPYAEALDLQHRLRAQRQAERLPDVLLLLEHPPVYTRGRRSEPGELPHPAAWYAERGIEVVDTRRGGKVTYHGPGQLVGYLVVRAPDLPALVAGIEEAILATLAAHGVPARTRMDEGAAYTGVWVQDRKIASIGLHRERGVTAHGLGLNVLTDLAPFGWVTPCGLTAPMTSVALERGEPDLAAAPGQDPEALMVPVRERLAADLARALGRCAASTTPAELHERLATAERASTEPTSPGDVPAPAPDAAATRRPTAEPAPSGAVTVR